MFVATISVIIIMTAFDIILSYLNYSYRNKPIPKNVSDVYSDNEYKKWLDYSMERRKIGIIETLYNTLILLIFFITGFFSYISNVAKTLSDSFIIQNLIFLFFYFLISYLLNIGFDIYKTFSIEERYGFNKTTSKTFIIDQLKSIGLTVVFGGALLYSVFYFHLSFRQQFVLYSGLLIISISIILNLLYTKVFIKIFNKLEPLEKNELYDEILHLANETGYEVGEISVIDASKRSSRLNAFFSGFSKFKQIVLYDNLIDKFSSEEVISVLAHEIGHYKHRDIIKNIIISVVQITAFIAILSFFFNYQPLYESFGFNTVHYGFGLILFSILIQPIMIVINIPLSFISRVAEYKADEYAIKHNGKENMISALKKLAKENFSNLNPHPVVVMFSYSHPPLHKRIEAIEKK